MRTRVLKSVTISTQSSSAHVEERDQEHIAKPVSTGVENEVLDCCPQTSWGAQWLSSGWHQWYQERLVLKFPIVTGECGAERIADNKNQTIQYILPLLIFHSTCLTVQVKQHKSEFWISIYYLINLPYHIFLDFIFFVGSCHTAISFELEIRINGRVTFKQIWHNISSWTSPTCTGWRSERVSRTPLSNSFISSKTTVWPC